MITKDIESLLTLFNIKKKNDLIKYCKNVQIYQSDFVLLIKTCKLGFEYNYAFHRDDRLPEHLKLTESDHLALAANGIGPAKGKAKTTINKIFQTFKDNRSLIGHLFYSDNLKYWYLFFFDNRDLEEYKNHWKFGKHIHLISDLWFPQLNAQDAWIKFWHGALQTTSKAHIRYIV